MQASCTGTGTPLRVGVHPQCHVSLLFPCGLGLGDRRSLPAGHARKLQSVWPPGEMLCSRAGLAGARSGLGKVANSAPSSCPGQGKGSVQSAFEVVVGGVVSHDHLVELL